MNGKKRVLITGGTGYIGSNLVNKLILNDQIEVSLVVRNLLNARKIFGNKILYIQYKDLVKFTEDVSSFFPEVVVHLAAYSTSSDKPEEVTKLIESNIIFTANLLLSLENCNLELFINTGSFSEYHKDPKIFSPTYLYSATKTSARYIIEYYAKKNDFNFINAILFTVYGKPNTTKKIIDYAIDSLNSDVAINMSDGKQILDFVHIDDVVDLYDNLINNSDNVKASRIDYDIGTGKCISIRELVNILEVLSNKKANISWGTNKKRKIDTVKACADIGITESELKYKTNIDLENGLIRYIQERV